MCVLVHVGTDRDVPEIPETTPPSPFLAKKVDDRLPEVRGKYIYYCGSHEWCGCGFDKRRLPEDLLRDTQAGLELGEFSDDLVGRWYDMVYSPPPQNPEDLAEFVERLAKGNESVAALDRFIADARPADVRVCWAGAEMEPPDEIITIPRGQTLTMPFHEFHEDWSLNRLYRFE